MKFIILLCSIVAVVFCIQALPIKLEADELFVREDLSHGGREIRETIYPYLQYPCPDTRGSKHKACDPYCKRRSSTLPRGRCIFGTCRCRSPRTTEAPTVETTTITSTVSSTILSDLSKETTSITFTNGLANTTSTISSIIISDLSET